MPVVIYLIFWKISISERFFDKGTDQNIDAIREFRNAVSHHKFMFYEL